MRDQLNDPDRDNQAEVWRNAQHRRAEDIAMWLRHFLGKRRHPHQSIRNSVTTAAATTPDAARYAGGAR
jgi:hypothetical protein